MNGLEELLAKRWILKVEDRELYYRIKDNLEEIRRYATEKLGCQLIVNSHMIKLEKIPPQAECYMGITEFAEKREYGFLCMILMFLEDKEAQDQFVLSQMTEYIAAHMPGGRVDWTVYTARKQLIRVMRFCIENQLIRVTDGDEEGFAANDSTEVLYENTGISRYFMKSFTRDIQRFTAVSDFEKSDWVDVNEDRGIARRHRIYKRLLFSPGIYRNSDEDEDFAYLKNYGGRLAEDFETNLNCRLQIYKNSAFLIMNEGCRLGKAFPENHSLSDITLLCNHHFLEQWHTGKLMMDSYERIHMDIVTFEKELLECRVQYLDGFLKSYREKTSSEFVKLLTDYMEQNGFIKISRSQQQVTLLPIVGRISGHYPEEFASVKGKDTVTGNDTAKENEES